VKRLANSRLAAAAIDLYRSLISGEAQDWIKELNQIVANAIDGT
jgi:hypothetical protein